MSEDVIIFGTGLFYARRKHMLPEQTRIVAFIDNNKNIQGTFVDDVLVYDPGETLNLKFKSILLASITPIEMKEQLLMLGIPKEKIIFWDQYVSSNTHGILNKYEVCKGQYDKKVLLIVPFINYTGSFLAALYAALAMQNTRYKVVISAPLANDVTVQEVNSYGIDVWLCPALPYVEEEEMSWIQEFDFVLLNTLQSITCVNRISMRKPVFWWIHESSSSYKRILEQYDSEIETSLFQNITVLAVSNIAKKNYFKYFFRQEQEVKLLTFGLPDFYNQVDLCNEKIVIAIIGDISESKNQKEFINAYNKLPTNQKNRIQCWMIGGDGRKKYKEEMEQLTLDIHQIKLCGEMSRSEIEQVFQQIDVVVCSSLEETMSIAIVEGMMNYKICITNTNTGIAEFMKDNENGFIYEAGNDDDLSAKLKFVIQNYGSLNHIREKARLTYEQYFSMNTFSNRLLELLEDHNLYNDYNK